MCVCDLAAFLDLFLSVKPIFWGIRTRLKPENPECHEIEGDLHAETAETLACAKSD